MTQERVQSSIWPKAIIGVFVLLAIWNAFVLKFALQSRTGSVDTQPYEQGLEYQSIISQREAARNAGLKADFNLTKDGAGVVIAGLSSSGPWVAKLRLIRPDNDRFDISSEVSASGPEFMFQTGGLKPGLWMVQLSVSQGDTTYFFESREVVSAD